LRLKNRKFARYFRHVSRWTNVLTGRYNRDELSGLIENDLPPKPRVDLASDHIATDWQGNPVASALVFTLRRAVPGRPSGSEEYEQGAYLTSGWLVVLPPPTEVSDEEAVRILLEDFCGIQARSLAPAWAQSIPMPGDDARQAAVAQATSALEEAQRRHQEALAAQAAAGEFRRLLFEKGPPLQEVARKTFEAIGICTVDSPVSDEFMLARGEERALVEVTGSGKSISGRDLSQLMKDLSNYLAQEGQDVKGLLVGNAWNTLLPDDRDTPDKPIFPDNVQTTARNRNIALLSTIELFRGYCAFSQGKLEPHEAFARLMAASGPVKLVD